jgi:hypothetical protein
VNLLKKGPANIPSEISISQATGELYADRSFALTDDDLEYLRWNEVEGFEDFNTFDDETVHFTEANQGGFANCYFV